MKTEVPVFLIVTPAFNSAGFIDETILSVVSQAGAFRIRYHVQDGGSTDGTVAALERWASRLGSGTFPLLCSGVEFTFRSEPDTGMYDAINRGFAHLNPAGAEHMTYINSDDRLFPGALQFAASVFGESPEIAWLGGRPCEMNEKGELMQIHEEQVYPTASLQAGLHDGRSLPFVMQEGTFWRSALWIKAGGFRTDLRQAGDWDLWRRFAAETSYYSVDVILAAHRRHEDQLTADKGVYYREVDQVSGDECVGLYASELTRFRAWEGDSEEDCEGRYFGRFLRFRPDARHAGGGRWVAAQRAYRTNLKSSIAVTNGFTNVTIPAEFDTGFGPTCDADLAHNLLSGFRVSTSATGSLRFHARRDGLHRIFLHLRNFDAGVRLTLCNRSRILLDAELPVTGYERDCLAIAESVFTQGPNVISIAFSGSDPRKVPVLIVASCEAMCTI
uniref:Glycosyl transferase, family 2 n=1 Tax=Solibacter usitatus (strain Ellin6076) TaxID=234267 RepID=Q02BE9_SOLUE